MSSPRARDLQKVIVVSIPEAFGKIANVILEMRWARKAEFYYLFNL